MPPHRQALGALLALAAGAFALGLFPMPYGYYALSRVAGFAACAFGAYVTFERSPGLAAVLGVLAVLYNPFAPIHLGEKALWTLANAATIALLFVAYRGLPESE